MSRPRKRTDATMQILRHEALQRSLCTPNKKLARQLGLSPGYISKIIWHLNHDPEFEMGSTLPPGPLEPEKIA
jgi:hypothetical protein